MTLKIKPVDLLTVALLEPTKRPRPVAPAQRRAVESRLRRFAVWPDACPPPSAVLPGAVIALTGAFVLWTRFVPLDNSLWSDEVHSVISYINVGPSGIWGSYTANDHMFFELISWITVKLLHGTTEEAYRVWGVGPAIAAAVLLTGWSWRRLGSWVAATFAVLFATAPLVMSLSVQARGYGLGFLAAALMLIGADALAFRGATTKSLWIFGCGALLGILTLPTFALPVIATASILFLRPRLRGPVVRTMVPVLIIAAAFYAPVLGPLRSTASSLTSSALGWNGFFVGPLRDLIAPSAQLIDPSLSLTAAEIISAVILVVGFVVLVLRPDRFLALQLLLPTIFTYLAFQVLHATEADRFMSYLMPALLLLSSIALVEVGMRLALLARWIAPVLAFAAVAALLFTLHQGENQFITGPRVPLENWKQAAAVAGSERTVVTNSRYYDNLEYYLGYRPKVILDAKPLESTICSDTGAFAYVEHSESPSPQVSTSCLSTRGAVQIPITQNRYALSVWLVPPKPARAAAGTSRGS